MKGEILFEKMTGISDEYVMEAALVAPVGVAAPKKKPFASLSRALNSGWGVACICLLLAIAAVVSILHWGLPGASVNPFPPAVDPNAPRYVYSMGSLHSFSHGESVDRPVERGEDIYLTVSVQNNGPAFQIRDSEWAQLSAVCVLQGDDSVTLEWRYSPRDGGNQPYWVQTGATETLGFVLTIPENATPGVYDLVLSFDGEKQVFGGALTVGEATETYPPAEEGHAFSFGYEPFGGFAIPGDFVRIEAWVINDGEPFTYIGNSYKETGRFYPTVTLYHQETGYTIKVLPPETAIEPILYTVETGEKGKNTYARMIPTDAPTGEYDLELSYGGASQKFESVLTVGEVEEGETYPPVDTTDRYGFSFEYEVLNTYDPAYAAWRAGDTIRIQVSVTNQGASFEYEGSSGDFIPHAVLSLTTADDPRQTLQVYGLDIPLPDDHGVFTVAEGETGTAVYEFVLPNDIPAGTLYLTMSYDGQETGNTRVGNVSDATYTMEEAIAFAKELLAVQYPEIDLSGYAIRCVDSLGTGLHYRVQFSYLYYGYTVGGGDMIDVSLTADKRLAEIEMTDEYGEHTAYLTQEVFLTAAQHIRDGIALADPSVDPDEVMNQLLYFHIDKEGYFCLALEYIGPPILDENGNSLSGCGDHEHYFFSDQLYITP